jgi:hypothetical protein
LPYLSQETLLARKQFSVTDRPIGQAGLLRLALDQRSLELSLIE